MKEELSAELQQLLDRQAIEDVLVRYSRAVDRADIELLRSCYHEGATEDHGGVFKGSAHEYVNHIAGVLPRARFLNHLVTNVLVEFESALAAKVEAHILTFARMKKDAEKFDTWTLARAVDRFEKREGKWAIAARCLCFEWNQEVPMNESWGRGMMVPDPAALVRGGKRPDDILYKD